MNSDKNKDEQVLEILKQELDRSYTGLNTHYNILIQMLVIVVPLIGGLVAYIYLTNDPPILLLFISPLTVLAILGIALVLLYQIQALLFFTRDTSSKIKELLGTDEYLLYYDKQSFSSRAQSIRRRGNFGLKAVQAGLMIIAFILYVGLLVLSFVIIYPKNHFLGSLFLVFYGISLMWAWLGFYGIIVEFPASYKKYTDYSQVEKTQRLPQFSFLNILLPRPIDFLSKTSLFLTGCAVAYFEGNISYHPTLVDSILSPVSSSKITGTVLHVIFWFLIQEGLVQQAKYVWNDIRDRNRDKIIPANQYRPINKRPISCGTYAGLVFRWVLGLSLAYYFASDLFVLVVLVSLLQILYELWAKPMSTKLPLVSLFIVATGPLIRFLGGALATGGAINDMRLLAYALVLFTLGVTYAAIMWKVEAEHLRSQDIPFQRGQSQYFLNHGQLWLFTSQVISVIVLVSLILDGYFNFYSMTSFAMIWNVTLSIIFGVLICLSTFQVINWLDHKRAHVDRKHYYKMIEGSFRKWAYFTPYIVILAVISWVVNSGGIAIFNNQNIIVSLVFSLGIIFLLQFCSRLNYGEITLQYAMENIPILLKIYFQYLFTAQAGIKFIHVIHLTILLNSQDFGLLIKEHLNEGVPANPA